MSADPANAAVPTGSVQFYLDGTAISTPAGVDGNGNASKACLPSVSVGQHTLTAVRSYRGTVVACTATTSAITGVATCTGRVSRLVLLLNSTYTATYKATTD